MSNINTDPPNPDAIEDIFSINKNAENASERRLALEVCLNGRWRNEDIGQLERVDTSIWHGWRMWPWKEDGGN